MLTLLSQSDPTLASALLFYTFATLVAASAIGVALSRNIVRMAAMLMFALVGIAGLYFLLGSEFLAAVQLVVYAGATLILIIFGVMLTSKSPYSRFNPSRGEIAIACTVAVITLVGLVAAILALPTPAPVASTASDYPIAQLGTALLGDYLVPFELASVLLLIAMIGAAYLAKARRGAKHAESPQAPTLSHQARQWS